MLDLLAAARWMLTPSWRTRVIHAVLLAGCAHAQLTMTISNPTISGQRGDVITLSGTLTASADISLLPGSSPSVLTSSVLSLGANRLTINSLPMNGSYTGPIVDVQVLQSANPGSYPVNNFQLSFDDSNGRTFFTAASNLTVNVVALPPPVPAPPTLTLVLTGLVGAGLYQLWRRFSRIPG